MSAICKKSQITLMMILGIVVLISVGFVFYLSNSAKEKKNTSNIDEQSQNSIDINPVKEFVRACVDRLAKNAIVLIGAQGGYIYKNEGGTLIDYQETDAGLFFVNYNDKKVSYNIMRPKFVIPPHSATVPEYPWHTFPYKTAQSSAPVFEGFFGINKLPPLLSSEGPQSIQEQIKSYIDNNLLNCANFDNFNHSFEIELAIPNTSVVIGNSHLGISTAFPIKVKNSATNEFTQVNEFSSNLNINLKDLYYFTQNLVENEITNIKFNVSSPKNNRDTYSIRVIKDVYSNDDIIIITDRQMLVDGKPFEYVFARKNRAPAMHYLRSNLYEFSQDYEIQEQDIFIQSDFKAEDPDEDSYNYTIIKGKSGQEKAQFPYILRIPQVDFKIQVTDGELIDYQVITVNRK